MDDRANLSLPEPDTYARAHSDRLRQLLADRIGEAGKPVAFSEYMSQVLYAPGLGYYMAGAAKFGADGDFITAPEVTPLFGAALGVQAREVLECIGGGILELGAGSGRLAAGLLPKLNLSMDITYTILEPSAELVQRQQKLLESTLTAEQYSRVNWIDTLPAKFEGVIIANEVMDALPVERFQICPPNLDQPITQMHVSSDLEVVMQPASDALQSAVKGIETDLGAPLPEGYLSEVCLLLKPWLASLAQSLVRGVILLIDYGYPRREYYLAERNQGTLACYYRHRMHDDPFLWPGLQDITAHVDFTTVVETAIIHQMELLGYASQSAFLLDNDLLALAEENRLALNSEMDRIALLKDIKTLTLPGEMGERFQVMALGKGYDGALQGFRTQDLSYRL